MTLTTNPSGLQFEDTVLGTGAIAKAGQNVSVHYTGWLFTTACRALSLIQAKTVGNRFSFRSAQAKSLKAGTRACRACRLAVRVA